MFNKKSLVNRIFLIETVLLIMVGLLSLFIKFINPVAMVMFGIWSLTFLIALMYNAALISKLKLDKRDLLVLLIISLVIIGFYAIILYKNKVIYQWDQLTYYMGDLDLFDCFNDSFVHGIKRIIGTTFKDDYGYFLLSFINIPFVFTNRVEDYFILSYSITILVPVIITFYLNIKKYFQMNNGSNKKYVILVMMMIAMFPLLHGAAINGQPDFVGLIFVNLIILLTMDYDFKKFDLFRYIVLAICMFCLVISRRWYMYWILGYFLSLAIVLLYYQIKNKFKDFKIVLKNLMVFSGICFILVGLMLLPMWIRILKQDFSGYSAWNTGGYALEISDQIKRLGLLAVLVLIGGIIYGFIQKKTRRDTFLHFSTWFIAFIAFVKTQNMGYHQSLILFPSYVYLMTNLIIMISKLRIRIIKIISTILIIAFIVFNFSCSVMKINNKFVSVISLYPTVREDYDKTLEITNFILDNTKDGETVYINSAGYWCAHTFRSLIYPDRKLDDVIIYEAAIDEVHGFPISSIATAKYIFVTNVRIESTGAKQGHIVPAINDALNNDTIIRSKFKFVKEFKMNEWATFYCYERVMKYDLMESNYWKNVFLEQTNEYPKFFGDRIDEFNEYYFKEVSINE